ncbi:MAG: thiosulfate oxidation carrier protein SoxY [Deltaproteobacteria bacterium]|nr:thiosulfate oxidation carrier protein SoxY [Deltaproteobacteria bacterium]
METKNSTGTMRLNRRSFLSLVGGAALALPLATLLPKTAQAGSKEADEFLKSKVKGAMKDGRVTIIAPEIAENGNTVPITITVESPMTEKDYVKTVYLVAEGNPNPGVATFNLSPMMGEAKVDIRIRLAKTQKVIAVAEMSDGSAWKGSQEIKVTIGGCGG